MLGAIQQYVRDVRADAARCSPDPQDDMASSGLISKGTWKSNWHLQTYIQTLKEAYGEGLYGSPIGKYVTDFGLMGLANLLNGGAQK